MRKIYSKTKRERGGMQRQDNVPFLCHPSIFMAMANHLTPASMAMLMQTSKLAHLRVEQVLNTPAMIVALLGNWSPAQTAQFFRRYRHQVGCIVTQQLAENPDHVEANILFYLMCCVTPKMIDQQKLAHLIAHLKENKYPQRIIKSLSFIAEFLQTNVVALEDLFPDDRDYYLNLRGANLHQADLFGCDLSDADLRGADLHHADCRHTNLSGAECDGVMLTCALLDGATLVDASMNDIQEDLGFPYEPRLKSAIFFSGRDRQSINKTLQRYHQTSAIPDFLIDAIAEDFTQLDDETSLDERLAVLEAGMQDTLFATHSEPVIAFINRRLFSIFTNSQHKIAQQIALLKARQDNAAEPSSKKLK